MVFAIAARKGKAAEGATLYVNLRPCLGCLNLAIAAGVRRIIYEESWSYDRKLELQYRRLSRRLSAFVRAK